MLKEDEAARAAQLSAEEPSAHQQQNAFEARLIRAKEEIMLANERTAAADAGAIDAIIASARAHAGTPVACREEVEKKTDHAPQRRADMNRL